MRAKQLVFNSKQEAEQYYKEALRLKKTVSHPFINAQGKYQITQLGS